jgi:hypothetical protein
MKVKILHILLILSSLIGYLEWGGGNASFLIEAEMLIFSKLVTDPISVLHPFILIPLLGQLLLVITLFQRSPNRILSFTAIGMIAVIMLMILFIGVVSTNWKIFLSSVPFVVLVIIRFRIPLVA